MSRIEELAEQSGMTQYVAANNKYLERFAEMLINDACDMILDKDSSLKQRTLVYDILNRFFK